MSPILRGMYWSCNRGRSSAPERVPAVSRFCTSLAAALICTALQACVVFLPSTMEIYDPECQVVSKRMTLQDVQLGVIATCQNQSCLAMVVAAGVTAAASVIVSGSIVVVGNNAYWLERQSTCRPAK